MIHETSTYAVAIFAFFVAFVLGLSFYLGRKKQSAKGYYAAHGEIHWAVNGLAFAGDYLSAASFLGICGMIAFYGYDGFLYSVGYLAGWIVALFVIAEPIKRLGKFTFADALDSKFNSRGIKLTAAVSTLVISIFYLIPQMVGAGALVKPLLGLPHYAGVLIVGATVTLIVVTAGMVSTSWVQFIKGSLLVAFCTLLTVAILNRGLEVRGESIETGGVQILTPAELQERSADLIMPRNDTERQYLESYWNDLPYVLVYDPDNALHPQVWRKLPDGRLAETQVVRVTTDTTGHQEVWVNGKLRDIGEDRGRLHPVGSVVQLPGGAEQTGPLGPREYLATFADSTIATWGREVIAEGETVQTTVYYPKIIKGSVLLAPGGSPTFKAIREPLPAVDPTRPETKDAWWKALWGKLDFLSLMLALFCGTASLPHILIRYYTVKDQASARKSTIVGIAAIGFFYILTLYMGLGAMTSGALDPTDTNMAAPLLARSFSELLFAVISAIAFTTVLGTVAGLIMAASGAVAHDIMESTLRIKWDDHAKVKMGKAAAVLVGAIAIFLGIIFERMNVSFLVGWAFNIAASANLPSLVMLLFWPKTTKQGIAAAITVGMTSSLAWVLLSPKVYDEVYGIDPADSIIPFSQPGLVTIPLGFLVLVVVSLMTGRDGTTPLGAPVAEADTAEQAT